MMENQGKASRRALISVANKEGVVDFAKGLGDNEFIELAPEELNQLYGLYDTVMREEAARLDAKGLPGTKIYEEVRRLIEEYGK